MFAKMTKKATASQTGIRSESLVTYSLNYEFGCLTIWSREKQMGRTDEE
jgi:hypothetical protein